MKKTWRTKTARILSTAVLGFGLAGLLIASISAGFEDDPKGGFAVPNPDYLAWLHSHQISSDMPPLSAEGYALGHIPPRVDPYLYDTGEDADQAEIDALPARYDLRSQNKLTPVRDQGACGSCWSFAVCAAMESALRPGASWNFSEQHMIKNHGFKWGPCKGGNLTMAMAYLTRWTGPVNETDVPYSYLDPDGAASVRKHVQNVVFVPIRKNNGDNNKIKNMVKKYGAVSTSMYWDGAAFNSATNSYYNPDNPVGGHAVTIVGWDDNFSRNNFNRIPSRDGAFIVRNSWGPGWGEGGYFYVSYCDKYFGRRWYSAAFKKPESPSNYNKVYCYDISGWTDCYGYGRTTAWMANMFMAGNSESIQAVSFYTRGTKTSYVVRVYRGNTVGEPRSGILVTRKSGKLANPGYYTIKLKKKVGVTKGQRFSVVVKLTATGTDFPVPCEVRTPGFTKPKFSKGGKNQSFLSSNGTNWTDLNDLMKNANICLKAFAK